MSDDIRKPLGLFVFLILAVMIGYLVFDKPINKVDVQEASSTVKLMIPGGGHGSGTHIGNGYVITAGHVAEDNEYLTALTDTGEEIKATRLWTNNDYDISLLRLEGYENVEVSNLECRNLEIGEHITMEGNPLAMTFITTNGVVAGEPTSAYGSAWESVVPIDGAMAGGMSGGGAFDEDGDLIGVNVGVPLQSLGGFSSTFTGISFIVPSTVVCGLLAR